MSSPSLAQVTPPVLPGEVLADKYRVERVLGAGGMGFVVAARNVHLGKRVAIKMMLPSAAGVEKAVERFEREARAAAQLKSEHVAEVLDIGRLATGEPYIVMELLEGTDFEAVLRREERLEVEDAVEYVLQACEAVAEAHALGVVHRDLKPKNLFLSHRIDGTPVVKVLDFGISKWASTDADSHSLTSTNDVFGSPNYMSPEQIRSARDVDARTDIWSLGVILFELLTGRVPFVAESLPQLCALVLETPAPSVARLRPDVPEGLDAIVARCMERNRERRFPNVEALVAALGPFGPPRHQHRPSGARAVSVDGPTVFAPAAGSGPVGAPAAGSSAGRAHVVSYDTSASWVKTPVPGSKRGWRIARWAALPLVVAAAWTGLRARGTTPSSPLPSASGAAVASAVSDRSPLATPSSATAAPTAVAPTTIAAPVPVTSAVPTTLAEAVAAEPVKRVAPSLPARPSRDVRAPLADAGSARPLERPAGIASTAPSAPHVPAHSDDPFTPADRK